MLDFLEVIDHCGPELAESLVRVDHSLRREVRRGVRSLTEGNVNELARLASGVAEQSKTLALQVERLRAMLGDAGSSRSLVADWVAYAGAFEEACRTEGVEIEGGFPHYRAFPLEIRFQPEQFYVLLNRRRVHSLRPSALARLVRVQGEQLRNRPFADARFRQALLEAHSLLSGGVAHHTVVLRDVHRLLALREGTGPAGYTLEQFAFDIFRVRRAGLIEGTRRLVFVQGRTGAIVVPVKRGETDNLTALQVQEVE